MRNRNAPITPAVAKVVSAPVSTNTALLREKGYRPHADVYGSWYLVAMGTVLLDHVPRAEVLRCFGRSDLV